MKVVIVGGGKVGELLCADFSNTFEEVTLIDTNEQRVEKLICLSLLLLAMKLI